MGTIVNAEELAQHLKVTSATIHSWQRRGWIPCLKAGRRPVLFELDEVLQALRRRAAQQSKPGGGGQDE